MRAEYWSQYRSAAGVGVVVIEAARDAVLIGKGVVDFDVEQISGGGGERAIGHVVREVSIGRGKQREYIVDDGAAGVVEIVRQNVTWNGVVSNGIVQLNWSGLVQQRGKISTAKGFIGKAAGSRSPGPESEAFVGKEEKCLVASVVDMRNKNWTANGKPEIILGIHRFGKTQGVVLPAVGIESAIAQIIVNRAMKIIGSGF